MGLDEFLIPRGPSPARPSLTTRSLDDWLVAPPAVPEPASQAREATVSPPFSPTTATAPAPASFEIPRPSAPKAADTAVVDPARLDGYLAAAPLDDPARVAWPREFVEDEAVLDPSTLVTPRIPDLATDEGGRRPSETRAGRDAGAFNEVGRIGTPRESSPLDPRGPVRSASVDVEATDDAFERIEGRLTQVAERLERAAERLASPPPSIGSRPRAFRGRIDD